MTTSTTAWITPWRRVLASAVGRWRNLKPSANICRGACVIAKVLDWLGFSSQRHGHNEYNHGHDYGHGHTHGVVDPTIATSDRGIWAIKWSFVLLVATAILQVAVVLTSHSVALLADTIHNIADAGTAIPLWVAFALSRRKPTETFTYGYGRVEDF